MGVPFFADVPVIHSQPSSKKFRPVWSHTGLDKTAYLTGSPDDQVLAGNFANGKGDELLIVNEQGDIRLLSFNGSEWQTVFTEAAAIVPGQAKFYTADIDGDGRDELLTPSAVFGFDSVKGFTMVNTFSHALQAGEEILTGNFTGDKAEEILVVKPESTQLTLYQFGKQVGRSPTSRTFDLSDQTDLRWSYKKHFSTGDFTGDGTDELLAFGEGAVVIKLVDQHWLRVWSEALYNHFDGLEYPANMSGRTLLSGNFAAAHQGEELMVLDPDNGITAFGYEPSLQQWIPDPDDSYSQPYLGDWPLQTFNENTVQYILLRSDSLTTSLLAMRHSDCGGEWRSESRLLDLSIQLGEAAPGKKHAVNSDSFIIYPNPTNGMVHVESKFPLDRPVQVTLHSGEGRVVHTHKESVLPTNFILNFENLPSGIYFLELQSGEILEKHKISISH